MCKILKHTKPPKIHQTNLIVTNAETDKLNLTGQSAINSETSSRQYTNITTKIMFYLAMRILRFTLQPGFRNQHKMVQNQVTTLHTLHSLWFKAQNKKYGGG